MNFGMIALTDCSPIVIAHEKGLFKNTASTPPSPKARTGPAIRDSLSNGDIQATHMLIGMPIASTMGLARLAEEADDHSVAAQPQRPGHHAQGRNGRAKSAPTRRRSSRSSRRPRKLGEPLTFAMTFPPGTHAMWMRYYLAAGGINPGQGRVSLITVPPPQMVANMKIGKMDGFLRRRTVERPRHRGQHRLHLRHHAGHLEGSPGKSLRVHRGVRRQESEDRQGRAQGAARSQRLARRHGQPPRAMRHRQQADLHQLRREDDPRPLAGHYDYGDGRKKEDPNYMIFSKRNCNYPQPEICEMVAHAIPPLGHGHRRAGLRRRRQAGHARRTFTRRR